MADPIASSQATDDILAHTIRLPAHAVSRRTSAGLTMLFDRAKGVMYELNETASAVIELLGPEPRSVREIVATLSARFEADSGEIAEDVAVFVQDFTEAGLLIEE
jgi:hypothetical protein